MGDADREIAPIPAEIPKKKIVKKHMGVHPKKSTYTTRKNDKESTGRKIPTIIDKALQQSKQKGASDTNPKVKRVLQSHPRESLGAMLANEESKLKASKNVSIRRKGSFDSDSIRNEHSKEDSSGTNYNFNELDEEGLRGKEDSFGRYYKSSELDSFRAALSKVDSGQRMFEKHSKWENKLKTSVFGVNNNPQTRTRKKRKELLTHVSDVQKVTSPVATSTESQAAEEVTLADIVKFFAFLQERGVFEDAAAESSEGCDGDSEGTSWDEGEIVFHTNKLTVMYPGRDTVMDTVMAGELSPAELEPSLDEILRKEEEEKTYRKRQSQKTQ